MTPQKAQHILRTLEHGRWLDTGLAFPPKSIIRRSIRSLDQLRFLLEPSANSYPLVRFDALQRWLREDVEDETLAKTVEAITRSDRSYIDKCLAIYEAATQRIERLETIAQGEKDVLV